jgi:hypothetical protein
MQRSERRGDGAAFTVDTFAHYAAPRRLTNPRRT